MAGGIRIEGVAILGVYIPTSYPISFALPLMNQSLVLDVPSTAVTLLWFLGCMNVWNLIDGMDGLAAGVGLLVSSTLMLVAIHQMNYGSAALAPDIPRQFRTAGMGRPFSKVTSCFSVRANLRFGAANAQTAVSGPSWRSRIAPTPACSNGVRRPAAGCPRGPRGDACRRPNAGEGPGRRVAPREAGD